MKILIKFRFQKQNNLLKKKTDFFISTSNINYINIYFNVFIKINIKLNLY